MKKIQFLLYSLLFIYTSLFADYYVYDHTEQASKLYNNKQYLFCNDINSHFITKFDFPTYNYIEVIDSVTPHPGYTRYCDVYYHIDFYKAVKTCPDGQVPDSNGICHNPPPCTPPPKPAGNIIASFDTIDECTPFQKQNSYDVNNTKYTNLSCWQNTCDDSAMDKTVKLFGTPLPKCDPLSSITVPIKESDCTGNINFLGSSSAGSGIATYQKCDDTCYILEPLPASCTQLAFSKRSKCDLDLNDFTFKCSEPEDGKGFSTFTSSCKPKNLKKTPPPCDAQRKMWKDSCEAQNKTLAGQCVDNGLIVMTNTLHCDDIPTADCDTDWNEIPDGSGGCKCEDGYSYDRFHNCTMFLDPSDINDSNSSSPVPTVSSSDSAAHSDSKKDLNNNNSLNDKLKKMRSDLNTTNKTLAGLRNDFNTSNHILSKIKNSLFNDNDKYFNLDASVSNLNNGDIQKVSSFLSNVTSQFSTFRNNVSSQLDIVKNKYQDTRALLEGGFGAVSIPVGSSDGCFQTTIHGQKIDINPCPYLSKFSTIIYFVLTLSFMYSIFMFNFKYTLRSFE